MLGCDVIQETRSDPGYDAIRKWFLTLFSPRGNDNAGGTGPPAVPAQWLLLDQFHAPILGAARVAFIAGHRR